MSETKPVLAALQIEDHQLRLVVGQFFNGALYILYRHSLAVNGYDGGGIYNEKVLIEAIKKECALVSNELKCPLEAVLLCVPAYRFKKEKKTFEMLLVENKVREVDVKEILQNAYSVKVGNDLEIINVLCASYKINGITYPKIPLNEKSGMLTAEVDLLCGDKSAVYDLVRIVEKAGLKVLNIYQDEYASCYEAALFEQSFNGYVINIQLEGSHTVFTLLYNGRIVSGFNDNSGYDQLIKPLVNRYGLSYKDAERLLFRYGLIGQKTAEDRIINRWNENDQVKTITYKDIQESIYPQSNKMTENIYTYCSKILAVGNVTTFVTGQGANLQNLQESLTERFGHVVSCYCPDVLGCREPRWTALLGMLAIYKDNMSLGFKKDECLDQSIYKQNLLAREVEPTEEKNLSGKIKNFTDKIFVEKG